MQPARLGDGASALADSRFAFGDHVGVILLIDRHRRDGGGRRCVAPLLAKLELLRRVGLRPGDDAAHHIGGLVRQKLCRRRIGRRRNGLLPHFLQGGHMRLIAADRIHPLLAPVFLRGPVHAQHEACGCVARPHLVRLVLELIGGCPHVIGGCPHVPAKLREPAPHVSRAGFRYAAPIGRHLPRWLRQTGLDRLRVRELRHAQVIPAFLLPYFSYRLAPPDTADPSAVANPPIIRDRPALRACSAP